MKEIQTKEYIVNFWKNGFTLEFGRYFYIQIGWGKYGITKFNTKIAAEQEKGTK